MATGTVKQKILQVVERLPDTATFEDAIGMGGVSTVGLLDDGTRHYTGHFSSFHAMSQNIHSYRELMMKESSICRSASLPAVLAH